MVKKGKKNYVLINSVVYSVISSAPISKFTRVQQIKCCASTIEQGIHRNTKQLKSEWRPANHCAQIKREQSLICFFLCFVNSGIEGDLVACIAMSPLIREKLAPALIHTYCSVDIVEGLDVDKEEFDKFASRFERPC